MAGNDRSLLMAVSQKTVSDFFFKEKREEGKGERAAYIRRKGKDDRKSLCSQHLTKASVKHNLYKRLLLDSIS